jgi:hypothetical protein
MAAEVPRSGHFYFGETGHFHFGPTRHRARNGRLCRPGVVRGKWLWIPYARAGKVGEPLLACVYGFAYEERAALLQRRALLRNLSSASAALALMAAVVAIRGRLRRSRGLAAAGHSGKV